MVHPTGATQEAVEQQNISFKTALKTILPWFIIALGILVILYPRFAGKPLIPVWHYDNPKTKDFNELMNYPWWSVGVVYIVSYATRAWAALAFAFVLGGICATFINKDKMKQFMSSKKFSSYVIAGLTAPVLTVCSCAMIPIFGGILISGAGVGPALVFLLVAPAANILALIFTASIISWKIMVFRFLFSFVGAIIIGYIVGQTRWAREQEEKYGVIQTAAIDREATSFSGMSWASMIEAWTLLKIVAPYLVIGVFVVAYVERYFPTELAVAYLTGTFGIFLGAVIGVPTYTPTLVEVFLIKALIVKGMEPPAALAFLIGGPMISIPSMLGVSRIIGWKVVISYAILGVFVAFGAGLAYRAIVGNIL